MRRSWVPLPEEKELFCEVYIDESSQNHRFLVLGSLLIPHSHVELFNEDILKAREGTSVKCYEEDGSYGVMKWQKVRASNLDAYKATVKAAHSFRYRHQMSSLKEMGINCVAVDTSARPLHKTGEGDRNIGYDKELYFLCVISVANRYRDKLFWAYLDRRTTKQRTSETQDIINHGVHKWADNRGGSQTYPFRRFRFHDPEKCLGLQVVDIFMGALAYRLNGHYDEPKANPAKKALCDYIWETCNLDDPFRTVPFQTRRFMTWMHRPKKEDHRKRAWSKQPIDE